MPTTAGLAPRRMDNPVTYGVLTICLDAARTLQQTIDSVLQQDPAPKRYVFVDGGSTDGTLELIEANRAAAERQGIHVDVLHQPSPAPGHAGIPAAWNLGLQVLDSDLVFILNADDWYEPAAASRVLPVFAAHPEPDIVVSPVWLRPQPESPDLRLLRPRSLRLLPFLMPLPHPGCFVRRRVYETIGLFDERYAISADYDFVYRCRRAGMVIRCVAAPLVNMRPGGLAGQQRRRARRETLDIGLRHCSLSLLPRLAYALRCRLGR